MKQVKALFNKQPSKHLNKLSQVGLLAVTVLLLGGCAVPVIVKSIADEVVAGEKIEHYGLNKTQAAIIEGVDTLLVSYVEIDPDGNAKQQSDKKAAAFCQGYNDSSTTWAHEELLKPIPKCVTQAQQGKTITLVITESQTEAAGWRSKGNFEAMYINQQTEGLYNLNVNQSTASSFISEVVELTYLLMTVNEDSYQDSVAP